MAPECILSDYLEHAMAAAAYDKLDDGTFAGRIPPCKGVVAFGTTLMECEHLLRSTLEDWLFLGLKLGHPIPVLSGLDPNREPAREPLDAMQTQPFHSPFAQSRFRRPVLGLAASLHAP